MASLERAQVSDLTRIRELEGALEEEREARTRLVHDLRRATDRQTLLERELHRATADAEAARAEARTERDRARAIADELARMYRDLSTAQR